MVRRIEKCANLVLLLGAGMCVLVFGLLVWRHGLSLHYLVIPAFATMLVWGWRLPQSVKVNSVLCMLSMLVAVYSSELILTYFGSGISSMGAQAWLSFPQDANAQVAAERMKTVQITNQKFDTRTRLEVVRDMRAQGVHAYPDVFPMVLFAPSSRETIQSVLNIDHEEFLPVAGMAMTTTVFCNESGEYVVYESDEHGFHNPRGMWGKGPVEILALGDSYTHGVCVPSDKGFVAVVRSKHADTINLGVNGHGPLTTLATLKEYGPILEPKLVLWFYYEGNDLRDLDGWEKNSPLLMKYLTSSFSQHLFERQGEIDRSLRNYLDAAMTKATASVSFENILKLQRLRHAIQSLYERRSTKQGLPADLLDFVRHTGAPAAPGDLQLFERILAEAQTTAQTWEGRVVFVYLPTWERYRFPELASQDRDNVLMIARRLNLPIVDIHKIFSEHSDPLSLFPYRRYAHYNEAGHQLVGEEVLRQLRQL
jgi:lysophospholipase L1-like esterase